MFIRSKDFFEFSIISNMLQVKGPFNTESFYYSVTEGPIKCCTEGQNKYWRSNQVLKVQSRTEGVINYWRSIQLPKVLLTTSRLHRVALIRSFTHFGWDPSRRCYQISWLYSWLNGHFAFPSGCQWLCFSDDIGQNSISKVEWPD